MYLEALRGTRARGLARVNVYGFRLRQVEDAISVPSATKPPASSHKLSASGITGTPGKAGPTAPTPGGGGGSSGGGGGGMNCGGGGGRNGRPGPGNGGN